MGVIEFKKPEYSVYSFIEQGGRTVLERWFDENELPEALWGAIHGLLDIYESGGPLAIWASVKDLGNGFYGLLIPWKVHDPLCPVFRLGPFDEETEITFLAGGQWDQRQKRVRPYSAVGIAEQNLETLQGNWKRRRRE